MTLRSIETAYISIFVGEFRKISSESDAKLSGQAENNKKKRPYGSHT